MKCEMTRETNENRVGKIMGKGSACLLGIILIMLVVNLTACKREDSSDVSEAIADAVDTAEKAASRTADETAPPPEPFNEEVPTPETYEDYMKLAADSYDKQDWETALAYYQGAKGLDESRQETYRGISDTYLQIDDVVQALAILDEGMEKCSDKYGIDLISQRKEYILAATVAVRTKFTENEYDDDGEILSSNISEYDKNGNEIRYNSVYYGKGEESSSFTEYQYDGNGNQLDCKYTRYDSDGNIRHFSHETWAYDENGNEIEYAEVDENGNVTARSIREYDAFGYEIKYEKYDNAGKCIDKTIYNYDEHGNLILFAEYPDGNIMTMIEREYDENGNEIKALFYDSDGNITRVVESEYTEDKRKAKHIGYNGAGAVDEMIEYGYSEGGNLIRSVIYDYNDAGSINSILEHQYDENGRETDFYLYDNEKAVSYQSKTEYDKNGMAINYTGYDKNGDILVMRETEYDTFGKVIRENYYDAAGNLIRNYENGYDDLGSITRQAVYEDGALKSEKQTSYAYHYIGNIEAEAADYINNDITPEEYNLEQREIFTRFLNGAEKVRYVVNEVNGEGGKLVEETISDLIYRGYAVPYHETLEYAFLDMTGDGVEELIIRCGGIWVVQCSYGALKAIYDTDEYGDYLIRCNGRIGICHAYSTRNGDDCNEYCFLDEQGKSEIFIDTCERYDTSGDEYKSFYSVFDNDSFDTRDISKGEYYDIMSGMTEITIDWQKMEDDHD